MDENKRFYYDRVRSQSNASSSTYGYGYGYHNNNHRQTYRQATSGGLLSKLGIAFRLHTQGDPLLIGCGMLACAWLGGIIMFDAKERKQKSVEEIKESLEKSKASIKKAKSHKDEN